MKKIHIGYLAFLLIIMSGCQEKYDQIEGLKAFAKTYGYVKYFHPSDEASSIDWNRFAVYGTDKILKCKNQAELVTTLQTLFTPLAPGIVFSTKRQSYDLSTITPDSSQNYQLTYWQHEGVALYMNYQNGPYTSTRVNSYTEIDEGSSFGNLVNKTDPNNFKGKKFKYTGQAKLGANAEGTGHFWVRVDKADNTLGFFDNMNANPITSSEWTNYEIIGEIDENASNLAFGAYLMGKGEFFVDDFHLYYEQGDQWIEVPIDNHNFENPMIETFSSWSGKSKGYTYTITADNTAEGTASMMIKYEGIISKKLGEPIFEEHPTFGELIERPIGAGIFCQIPMALYTNEQHTFPTSNGFSTLKNKMADAQLVPENLALRLGNVINAYNVFLHFYPYKKEVNLDLEAALDQALQRSFKDKNGIDHRITLEKFTAHLKDGHAWVSGGALPEFTPPIRWDWIEDELVITNVLADDLAINIGDVVTKINGLTSQAYFEEIYSRISAGTKGWLNAEARAISLQGKKDSSMVLEINGKKRKLIHDQTFTYGINSSREANQKKYQALDNDLFYLNIGLVEMDTINALLPKLKAAKGIICDLRGYPNSNDEFISYLLSENDTSDAWMKIPQIIYPDQENIVKWDEAGWELEAKAPYLGDKDIVFITDGTAISYAESYLGLIKGYKLATIVGQPTAGANGNINPFRVAGNYTINWTGMKIVKHDGSQHHAIGVLPDIYVARTIHGLKEGKDEFLEKAIEVALN